jgi:hypothetical protein
VSREYAWERRRPTEVTADRIGDHLYNPAITSKLSGRERDLLSAARSLLMDIAERAS